MSASAFKRKISDKYYLRYKRLDLNVESQTGPCASSTTAPSDFSEIGLEITDNPRPYLSDCTNEESANSDLILILPRI